MFEKIKKHERRKSHKMMRFFFKKQQEIEEFKDRLREERRDLAKTHKM